MISRYAAARVLDQTSLSIDDRPVPITGRTRHIVAVLIAAGTDGIGEEDLIAELRPGLEPRLTPEAERQLLDELAQWLERVCPGMVDRDGGRWRLALPADRVDLWRFHELADDAKTDWSEPEHLTFLLTSDVFPGVHRTRQISQEENRFHDVRDEVARRESERAGSPLPDWLSLVRSRARLRRPSASDDDRAAQLPPRLQRHEERFLTTGADRASLYAVDNLARSEIVPAVILVTGLEGAGKTRLVARIVDRLVRLGWQPVEGVPVEPSMPDEPLDDRPIVVVADDYHLLTVDEIQRLERLWSTNGSDVGCLVIASSDGAPETVAIRRALMRRPAGTTFIPLEPLEVADVMELVADRFPTISAPLMASLASDLHHESWGLPSELMALLPLVDRRSYLLVGQEDETAGADGAGSEEPRDQTSRARTAVAAAERAATRGRYRDVVRILAAATEIDGIELDRETRALFINALHRTAAHDGAAELRTELVRELLADDDVEGALDAALIALPEAERTDGDRSRLNDLLSIPADRLDERRRAEHGNAIFRQATLQGDTALAQQWITAIGGSTNEPDDLAAGVVADWYATAVSDLPAKRLLRSESLEDDPRLSGEWRARVRQVRSLDLYQLGLLDAAIEMNQAFEHYADGADDHLRKWHAMAFRAMVAFDLGRWADAEALRDETLGHARRFSIVEGEVLFIAQSFHQAWLLGTHGDFAELADRLSPDVSGTRLGRAAVAAACLEAGDPFSARQLGLPVVDELLDEDNFESLATAALLAPLISTQADEETTDRIRALFDRRLGSAIVTGAGITSLGPVDRYLFQLTGDVAHLDGAIAWADRCGIPMWQVLLRLDYVRAGFPGSDLFHRQAKAIAAGTDLVRLLDGS